VDINPFLRVISTGWSISKTILDFDTEKQEDIPEDPLTPAPR
jgi:hypothetical protein